MIRLRPRGGISPGAGRFGQLVVAIVAAIVVGATAQDWGSGRSDKGDLRASIRAARVADTDELALADNSVAPTLVLDADGVDLNLSAATAALSRATSGIGVDDTCVVHYGLDWGQVVQQNGPNGAIRRVRIVTP
jgi:hypothetical protein